MMWAVGIPLLSLALFFGLEFGLRQLIWFINLRDPDLARLLFYSAEIHRHPNKAISFRLYGRNAELLIGADFRLNNMGLISYRDYSFERGPNEFRILVVGGEQTASSVANHSWPDLLEDELNRRNSAIRSKVFNLAWPDAGPEHYIQYWKEEGYKFDPDLVIVNYVETDFHRTLTGAPLHIRGVPIGHSRIAYSAGPGEDNSARSVTANPKDRPVTSLRDPNAVPGRPYGFFASHSLMTDPTRVAEIQRQIVNDMIAGGIPPFGSLLLRLFKGDINWLKTSRVRRFDPLPDQPVDREKMVQFGVANFGWMARNIPNLLITHNFNVWERSVRFELTDAMMAADPAIRVEDMRKRVPQDTSEEEYRSWYLMPYMGEKWSDKGHEAYAKLMSDLVLEWRAQNSNRVPARPSQAVR